MADDVDVKVLQKCLHISEKNVSECDPKQQSLKKTFVGYKKNHTGHWNNVGAARHFIE